MWTFIICTLLAAPMAAQDKSWKLELDNDLVRVTRRLVASRQTVSFSERALLVYLSQNSLRMSSTAGQKEIQSTRGQFLWHDKGQMTLENLSPNPLELVLVVPKFSTAPDASAAANNVVFENDLICVKHVNFARGGTAKLHSVPPYVAIHLSPAHLKFTLANGQVEEFRVQTGQIRFQPAAAFSGENRGDAMELLRIELKAGKQEK